MFFLSTYFCTQGYLRWQTSLDTISRTRTLTRTFSTSTLFMISSHFRAPALSSRAAPSTSSTWPSPTSCLRSSPRTRGGSPRPPSTAMSRSMCRKENPPRKNNGFILDQVRLLVWLLRFAMTSLFQYWALTTHGNHTGDCVIQKYGQCHPYCEDYY